MSAENETPAAKQTERNATSLGALFGLVVAGMVVVVVLFQIFYQVPDDVIREAERQALGQMVAQPMPAEEVLPRSLQGSGETNVWGHDFVFWWDDVPEDWKKRRLDTGTNSNIRLADLVGSDSCRECHEDNYNLWRKHGHSRMTTHATAETIVGDFSGRQSIEIDGGRGEFYREGDKHYMKLERDGRTTTFLVTRTIGWRHQQDYAGFLVNGPDPTGIGRDKVEHLLPFAYDVGDQHWMQPVHAWSDNDIPDSFMPHAAQPYALSCADCHMSYPVGDRMIRRMGLLGWEPYVPRQTSMHVAAYFAESHTNIVDPNRKFSDYSDEEVVRAANAVRDIRLEKKVPVQGVTCEACHYGGREHVENSTQEESKVLPAWFPISPHLVTEANGIKELHSKSPQNINFMCARCHRGQRQEYANGLHAWNSTEYTEAMNGHCYDPVKAAARGMKSMACTHCHNPHETVGLKWARTPRQDDLKCLACHQQFEDSQQRFAHTRHSAGDGSHCMDCHNPHTNEGLGRMVRTHRIMNPIDHQLIEANQVNSCNLCHLDKSINWTIKHLKEWYAPDFAPNAALMASNYQDRDAPVVREWLTSPHAPTRIATAGAIARRKAHFALLDLLDQLAAENYGYNKRVMQKAVNELLNIKLHQMGFNYLAPTAERQEVMKKLKPELLKRVADLPAGGKPLASK